MSIYYPSTFAHGSFGFNAELNADGTVDTADLLNTARLDRILENPGFRDLHDPYHLTQGGQLGRVHKGLRVLEFQGKVIVPEGSNATRYASMSDKVRAMRAAFDPSICYRDSPSTDGAYQYTFTEPTADTTHYPTGLMSLQYWLRPVGQPFIAEQRGERGQRDFRIPMLAADPRAFEQTESTLSTITSGSVINLGNTAAPLKVTVTMNGAGNAAFTITRAGVAYILDLSGMVNNDVVVVLMEKSAPYGSRGRYITKNGTENATLKTSAASTWLDAPVGTTVFTMTNTTNVRSCVFNWFSAWA